MRTTNRAFALAAALVTLVACGSDNKSTTTLTARTLQGAITALTATSVTVNGVTTDDSAIPAGKVVIDDNPSTHDLLKVGQVVTVKIDDNGKTAEIHSRPDVRGSSDDAGTASTITIGGQLVRVDDSTHFEDNTVRPGTIAAGTRVRVSGFPDDRGGLRASRIDKDTSSSNDFEIHGVVTAVTSGSFTLKVGQTTYTVNIASVPATVVVGAFVEVHAAAKPAAGVITATSVKVDDDDALLRGQAEAEVEGIVLSGNSSTFVVGTRTVTTTSATKFVGGAPADLIPGVKVEAEGPADSSGNIAATKVVFHDSLRFQGAVTAITPVDAANGSFTMLGGTLTVHVSAVTDIDPAVTLAALGTLNVEVRGYPTVAGGNDIVATRIKLGTGGGNPSTRVAIQGPITNLDATAKTFQILGYTIKASGAASLSREDNPLSNDSSAAFNGLTNGTVVKARANAESALSGTTLTATEVEVEDDK